MKQMILIGNYLPDRQESMLRFSALLEKGYAQEGIKTVTWRPKPFFGFFFSSTNTGIGKWMGYIDKWILFPLYLKRQLLNRNFRTSSVRFHICDHSNAPYLKYLPANKTVITCHDVLAIRGALGYEGAYVGASRAGLYFQKWILSYLSKARLLAAVSENTLKQLRELPETKGSSGKWTVISNSFNEKFECLSVKEASHRLKNSGLKDKAFILHVGSDLARKNRKLLIDMVSDLGANWDGLICYAGTAVDDNLLQYAAYSNLQHRIVSVVKPDHNTLEALYNACEAFIFPSYSEGFGWPLIEAQACGAPVIASNIDPLPEVTAGAALHAHPDKSDDFAKAFLSLRDSAIRNKLIENGFENCKRFTPATMIQSYLALHQFKEHQTHEFIY
jgi:glycosyltransferase involved in cell wall biosynthesis